MASMTSITEVAQGRPAEEAELAGLRPGAGGPAAARRLYSDVI